MSKAGIALTENQNSHQIPIMINLSRIVNSLNKLTFMPFGRSFAGSIVRASICNGCWQAIKYGIRHVQHAKQWCIKCGTQQGQCCCNEAAAAAATYL